MEDLAGKLNSILNSPEGMKLVQELAGMLGLHPQSGASPPPAAPAPAAAPVPAPLAGVSPDMVNAMMRMAPLFSALQQEDDTTRLLQALRPLLSEERRRKVDRAIQMVRMLRLLPMLQESGMLSSLLKLI